VCWSSLFLLVNPFEKDDGTDCLKKEDFDVMGITLCLRMSQHHPMQENKKK
jgi:hypothetical protein